MDQPKTKTSLYLPPAQYKQAMAYKRASGLSFNAICLIALDEFLQQKDRQRLLERFAETESNPK